MTVVSVTKAAGDTVTAAERNALREDILREAGDTLTDSGAANAYIVTCDNQITSLTAGQVVKMIITNLNTGASTLRFKNSLALDETDNIYLPDLSIVRAGDLPASGTALLIFDGTQWILCNPRRNIQGAVYKVTAGETIAVNEVVCYDTTENEWMLADANNTARVRARGIALSAGTNGTIMLIQVTGIFNAPSGTPFTAETQEYLSDTPGAVSGTPSATTSVPVGYATSTTEMILTWGKKMARGTGTSYSTSGGTQNEVITTGFRPELVVLSGKVQANNASTIEQGFLNYINGVFAGGFAYDDLNAIDSANMPSGGLTRSGGGVSTTLTMQSPTDTGFTIRTVLVGAAGGSSNINWYAIGE